jgi:hypothetical protein
VEPIAADLAAGGGHTHDPGALAKALEGLL